MLAVCFLSLLAIPMTYITNTAQTLHGELGLFVTGVVCLLVVCYLAKLALSSSATRHSEGHRKNWLLYVFTLGSFASVVDLLIGLETDGYVHGFMSVYLRNGEPYLGTPYGALISYWDGTAHYAMYLFMLAAMTYKWNYRVVGLYWAGSIGHSMLVLIPGAVIGYCHLLFHKSGNHYTWQKVESSIHNIIVGQLWIDHHGECTITNHRAGDTCQLVFSSYSIIYKESFRKVTGIITDSQNAVRFIIQGAWDDKIERSKVVSTSQSSRGKMSFSTEPAVVIWERIDPPLNASYNFSQLAIELNEPEPSTAPTDSRLRPDLRLMEQSQTEEADKIKILLEEKQRSARRRRMQSLVVSKGLDVDQPDALSYEPKWFKKLEDPLTGSPIFRFTNEYWMCKKKQDWSRCPNIFL